MDLNFRYYTGGEYNPYANELRKAQKALVAEAVVEMRREGRKSERSLDELMPTLYAWPDYVVARSKDVFWRGERDLSIDREASERAVEALWKEAGERNEIGRFLKETEAPEGAKAQCYYMAMDYMRKSPHDKSVDFRLYLSEAVEKVARYTLEAFEG